MFIAFRVELNSLDLVDGLLVEEEVPLEPPQLRLQRGQLHLLQLRVLQVQVDRVDDEVQHEEHAHGHPKGHQHVRLPYPHRHPKPNRNTVACGLKFGKCQ